MRATLIGRSLIEEKHDFTHEGKKHSWTAVTVFDRNEEHFGGVNSSEGFQRKDVHKMHMFLGNESEALAKLKADGLQNPFKDFS